MVKFSWCSNKVPKDMKITQVYGLIFDKSGRLLLRVENKNGKRNFGLAGGTPELFDNSIEETLRREVFEEVNVELEKDVFYVGYQLVENDGDNPAYAQVRLAAIIKSIGEKLPDVDGGEVYDRVLVSPENAIKLLSWGDVGRAMIQKAVKIAKEKFNINFDKNSEQLWV